MNEWWMSGRKVNEKLWTLTIPLLLQLCDPKSIKKMFFIDMKSETYSTLSQYHGFAFRNYQYYLHKGGK